MLEVRLAQANEFDIVLAFYTRMIDEMKGTDFDVSWKHGVHPSPEFIRASIENDELYIGVLYSEDERSGENDTPATTHTPRIACAMIMNAEGATGYETVPWGIQADPRETGILHVVATLPELHGRGFARQLVLGGLDAARAKGLKAVRLDTFPHNVRGRGLYESCGFDLRGIHTLFYPELGNIEVAMYEYVL